MKATLKCRDCHEDFPREEIIQYTPVGRKTIYTLCNKCYKERIKREKFSCIVCRIFGLKAPGPRIWAERERLQKKYGYTDDIICDTLEYLYNVKNIKKIAESLCMVKPETVEEMLTYKHNENTKMNLFKKMSEKEYKYEYVDIRENEDKEIVDDNLDDFLEL